MKVVGMAWFYGDILSGLSEPQVRPAIELQSRGPDSVGRGDAIKTHYNADMSI